MSDRPPPVSTLVGVVPLAASRFLRRLALFALASPLAAAIVELVGHPWANAAWMEIWRTSLVAGPLFAGALGVAGVALSAWRGSRPGTARVEGADLVVEGAAGARRFPLARLRSGVVVPDVFGRMARVEFALASGDQLFAEVESVQAGERLLASAGIDAARRRCTVPLATTAESALRRGGAIAAGIVGSFLALGLLIGAVGPIDRMWIPVWLALTTAAAVLAAHVARARSITIGADGLVVPGLLRDRFVPFAEIASARAEGGGVALLLRGHPGPVVYRADADAARAVALRIQEALEARSSLPAAQARLDLLSRGGRTLAVWRQDASRLVERAAGYRAAGLSEDDLAALLASPDASAEHRVGAALALAAAGDAHRERLRIAAAACAGPRMRIALERIAAGEVEDAAIEEALAGEAEEARGSAGA